MALSIPVLWWSSAGFPQIGKSELSDEVQDYRAYLHAIELQTEGKYAEVISELAPVFKLTPASPLKAKAAILSAEAALDLGEPQRAIEVLRESLAELPQPQGLALLAKASEFAGAKAQAAGYRQRVYVEFPLSEEGKAAEAALPRLELELRDNYPPVSPRSLHDRAAKLMKAGQRARAQKEYALIAAIAGGRDRDLALVRAATGAYAELKSLKVADTDADAERIYLMHAAARKDNREADAVAAVEELDQKHPASTWRLEALVSLGNMYLLRNEADKYKPVFERCYVGFPKDDRSAYCHWKATWTEHVQRSVSAPSLLRDHVQRYPKSEKTAAALYYLGRHSELVQQYPNAYYAALVENKITPVARAASREFGVSPTLAKRMKRSKILGDAGLLDWAEFELKYAAKNEASKYAAAMAVAEVAIARGAHDQAIRYIKSYTPDYLSIAHPEAPVRFWRIAFPMPYRESLERACAENGLPPAMVAALIRQESEFNPRAVSSAKAYGLTQVLPSTGRMLSRPLGVRNFTASSLFDPDLNLRMGTRYLKTLLDKNEGSWERTLAGYNAGHSRVVEWNTWAEYREPSEFIETIPFTETRNYVQIVIRNAAIYKRLYSNERSSR